MNNYALITGSSKGLGRAMAHSLAKRGYNLILVARSQNQLTDLKHESAGVGFFLNHDWTE